MVLLIEKNADLAAAWITILKNHGLDVEHLPRLDKSPARRDWQAVIIGEANIKAGTLDGLKVIYIKEAIHQMMNPAGGKVFSITHSHVTINYHEPPDTTD